MNQYTQEPVRHKIPVTKYGFTSKNCAICGGAASAKTNSFAAFRDRTYRICLVCRTNYDDAMQQFRACGMRFRFVGQDEIPHPYDANAPATTFHGYRPFRQIYKVLLLLKERQEKRQKEVNWMVDEMTISILKLPDRIAAVVAKTFAVCGDDFKLGDDEALIRIRDLLEEIDPEIINRNKNKRLS